MDDIEEAHSHVNFMDLASNRAAYRLADQYDQEVLGYMSGYAQSSLHSKASTLNTTVNGTKAVSTAGSNELLSSMQLHKGDFGNITTTSAGTSFYSCNCSYAWSYITTNSNCFTCNDHITHETFARPTTS